MPLERITLDSLSFSKHFSLGRGGGPERTVFCGLVVETEFFHAGCTPRVDLRLTGCLGYPSATCCACCLSCCACISFRRPALGKLPWLLNPCPCCGGLLLADFIIGEP